MTRVKGIEDAHDRVLDKTVLSSFAFEPTLYPPRELTATLPVSGSGLIHFKTLLRTRKVILCIVYNFLLVLCFDEIHF